MKSFYLALFFAMITMSGVAQKRPNIVLILADDLGYNDIAINGNKGVLTPNLDKLAGQGVRLTNFYVTAACTPTQSMLFTGRYPLRNGTYELFRNNRVNDGYRYSQYEHSVSPERILGMDLREITMGQVLQKAGYYTGLIGKWDLGMQRRFLPMQKGFEFYFGFPTTGVDYFTHERYGIPSMYDGNNLTLEYKGIYTTELFRRKAMEFLDKAGDGTDRPFFLFLSFNAPHGGSSFNSNGAQATEEFLKKYPEGKDEGSIKRRNYRASITEMDYAVGDVLKKLDSMGVMENTLIIFLSDNGGKTNTGADNSPLRGGKGTLYEGGTRVPCFVTWTKELESGQINDQFLSGLEIFPTLVAAAQATLPDTIVYDGFDMLPVLQNRMKSNRNKMFWYLRENKAARINNWKWVKRPDGEDELYNLTEDVGEQKNVAKEFSQVLSNLKSEFKNWKLRMDLSPARGPFKDF